MSRNNSNKERKETEDPQKKKDVKGIITVVCMVITLVMTGVNNYEIRKLNKNRYNLESYVGYNLAFDIKCDGEKSATLLINKNEETVNTTVPPIYISPQIGGIKKAYAVYYHDGSFWGIENFEKNNFSMDQYKSFDLEYRLDEYTLDYEEVDNSGDWYGTLYIVIQDFNDNYFYNMLVFKMDNDNNLIEFTTYDELQSKMLCNSENFRVTNMYESQMMKEFNSLVDELNEAGLDKDN